MKTITNVDKQYFFIVDKQNETIHRIDIVDGKGVIRQINEAYDNFLSKKEEELLNGE